MTTLTDIVDKIEELVEGSDGVESVIPVGKFTVVGDDYEQQQAQCSRDPRPVFITVNESYQDEMMPTDVSGDYRWRGRVIRIYAAYGFHPRDDPTERRNTINEDIETAQQCLEEPLNWALVVDWCATEISLTEIIDIRDDDEVVAIALAVIECQVTYREAV